MDREKLEAKIENATTMSCKPENIHRYREGTIIDEDKTVRWNKEEVARRNNAYNDAVRELNIKRNQAVNQAYEEAYVYIMEQVGNNCTRKQAMLLWNYAWRAKKSNGFTEVWDELDDLIILVKDFMCKG